MIVCVCDCVSMCGNVCCWCYFLGLFFPNKAMGTFLVVAWCGLKDGILPPTKTAASLSTEGKAIFSNMRCRASISRALKLSVMVVAAASFFLRNRMPKRAPTFLVVVVGGGLLLSLSSMVKSVDGCVVVAVVVVVVVCGGGGCE